MKTLEYFSKTFSRSNFLLKGFLGFFFSISSWPRLFLEVFVRRGFGSDYTSLFASSVIIAILGIYPYFYYKYQFFYDSSEYLFKFGTWYAYLIAFGYKSWIHHRENSLPHGHFDFNKHSNFTGDQDPRFNRFRLFGLEPNPRLISTIYEPGIFLIGGIILAVLKQPIGIVLIACSIIYSLGYFGAYTLGRMVAQEFINKSIFSEEMQQTMVTGKYPRGDKGFQFFDMPVNPEYRRKMADFIMRKDDIMDAY